MGIAHDYGNSLPSAESLIRKQIDPVLNQAGLEGDAHGLKNLSAGTDALGSDCQALVQDIPYPSPAGELSSLQISS